MPVIRWLVQRLPQGLPKQTRAVMRLRRRVFRSSNKRHLIGVIIAAGTKIVPTRERRLRESPGSD